MILEAYAKINWSLDITGVREDGYHLMDMLMQPVSLADEITLSPSDHIGITTGGWPPSRADETNLAFRAAKVLKEVTGYPFGVQIHVQKRIPIGAGMGGGSSDASAVLFGLNRMWKTGLSPSDLESIGLSVGADVPFCLRGGLARTTGIGEIITEYPCKTNWWMLVLQPCRGLSTREIFSSWNPDKTRRPNNESVLEDLKTGNLDSLGCHIANVLEPVSAARCPQIREAVESLICCGARAAAMTGSGSAVFGVFRSRPEAEAARTKIMKRWSGVHLCHTQHDSIRISEE